MGSLAAHAMLPIPFEAFPTSTWTLPCKPPSKSELKPGCTPLGEYVHSPSAVRSRAPGSLASIGDPPFAPALRSLRYSGLVELAGAMKAFGILGPEGTAAFE